jgi:hypothetical protein
LTRATTPVANAAQSSGSPPKRSEGDKLFLQAQQEIKLKVAIYCFHFQLKG